MLKRYCPNNGAKPFKHDNKYYTCEIVSVGTKPIDKSILNDEQLKQYEGGSIYLSIVLVPDVNEVGMIYYKRVEFMHGSLFKEPDKPKLTIHQNLILGKY